MSDHIHPSLRGLAVELKRLTPDPKNARKHDQRNIDAIRESLAEHGQRKPLVAQQAGKKLIVRAGNGTLEAAKALGWTHLAVVVVEEDDRAASRYALRDNRTAELAAWDDEALRHALRECAESVEDIAALGWTEREWAAATHEFVVEPVDDPAIKSGDREPFRQMTFVVHDQQHDEIERALSRAKQDGLGDSDINQNTNGNALAAICGAYLRG